MIKIKVEALQKKERKNKKQKKRLKRNMPYFVYIRVFAQKIKNKRRNTENYDFIIIYNIFFIKRI